MSKGTATTPSMWQARAHTTLPSTRSTLALRVSGYLQVCSLPLRVAGPTMPILGF